MSTSSHSLCIDNYSIVYSASEQIRAKWEDLATHLFVTRPSVEAIKADAKDCADCLRKLLDEWLKRSSPEQPLPSWRGLCNALAHLDRLLSESISAQHQCGCSLCTGGNVEAPIIGLVSPLYNEIYQKLKNPVGMAEYMYSKRAFSLHQLEKIHNSPGNEKEVLLTLLESAVSLNQYNLRVFGKALMKEEATHSLGKSLLANCIKEEFPSKSKIKEILVEMKYKREFQSMRTALGELCARTVTLLHQKRVSVSDLKNKLKLSFPEMASDLKECSSHNDVVSNVIRPRISLVQIDYLEAAFDLFKLRKRAIQEYNQKVDEVYKTVKVTYGQLLMEEFDGSTSELESIKFVLDWKENEHLLKDVQDLFKKIVRSYSSQVKVIVISEGNSIVVECCIPAHLLPVITRIIQDSEAILNREKVISVTAGGRTIFKRILTVDQKSELEVEPKKENNYEDADKSSVHSSDDQVAPLPSVEQETKTNQESLVKVPPKGSYDDEMFLSPPPKKLHCPVCQLTLREPQKFDCCGTIVCKVCIHHTNTSKACPHCHSTSLTVPVHDKRLEQEIMSLKVKCTNGDCEWRGELVDYNNHITDKCPNRVVQCQYDCGLYFMASEVSVHEEEECTKRPYEVIVQYYEKQVEATREFYQQQMILLEEKMEKYQQQEEKMEEKVTEAEEKYAASVKMNGMKNIEIDRLKEKIQSITSVMEATGHVTRDFPRWYGPSTDLISSSLPPCIRAMTSFTQHRLSGDSWYSPPFYTGPGGYKLQLRIDPNTSTKPEGISLLQQNREGPHISVCVHLMKGENDDCLGWPFKGSVTVKLLNWIEDKNHFEQSFSTTSAADPQYFSRVTSGVRATGEMYQRHFIAHRELEFNGERKTYYVMEDVLCFMISSVEVLSNYQSSLVPEWTYPELSLVSYGVLPVYRTVKEYNQLKAKDQEICTDPFYTAQGGYKMIMEVYPNGYGSCRGTHLSVFISLMRGENDHTLSFPINGIFKIQLLNWRQNSGHVEKIVQFDQSTPERYRLQVTTGEEAAGYGLFGYLSHDKLENSSDYKEYIHNNTLCFKIQFEQTQQRTVPPVPSWCDVMYTNSSTPPCTRTLTRYSEYKRTNSQWDSLPFYSRDKGYKLQLKVDANGDGSGKGTHLSLYVFLLKGEYDDQLQWPFNANITVQLLNWSGDSSHEEETINHHTAPLEYRTRVTEGGTAPGGRGYGQFISHSVLESVTSDTKYINEDSICFRIVNVEVI